MFKVLSFNMSCIGFPVLLVYACHWRMNQTATAQMKQYKFFEGDRSQGFHWSWGHFNAFLGFYKPELINLGVWTWNPIKDAYVLLIQTVVPTLPVICNQCFPFLLPQPSSYGTWTEVYRLLQPYNQITTYSLLRAVQEATLYRVLNNALLPSLQQESHL